MHYTEKNLLPVAAAEARTKHSSSATAQVNQVNCLRIYIIVSNEMCESEKTKLLLSQSKIIMTRASPRYTCPAPSRPRFAIAHAHARARDQGISSILPQPPNRVLTHDDGTKLHIRDSFFTTGTTLPYPTAKSHYKNLRTFVMTNI
jgi:hypothetical protein